VQIDASDRACVFREQGLRQTLLSCIRHAFGLLLQLHQDLVVTAYQMFVLGNSGETAWLSCPALPVVE
jgi:hypothetical protein